VLASLASKGELIRRVRAGEVELAYRLWPGKGPAIVAIHGLTASHVNFIGIAERLAGRRPLLAFDLRGRGQSDKPEGGYGMRQHARDVAAAMRSLGLGRSVVIGHSMGAYIGTALAADFPDLVAGLVMLDGGYLLDLPANFDPDQLLDTLLKPQVERLRATYPSRAGYLDFWRGLPAFPAADWGPWVEAYLEYDLGGEPPALRARAAEPAVREDFRSMAQKQEVKQRLLAVSCPVMVIRAEDGVAPGQPPIIPDQVMAEIRECLPSVEEHLIPGTTHYTIALADPGASDVADLVDNFAARCLDSTVISN
jgi:pimeloyl-ACP methyl ester carboxylesterase